MAEKITVPTLGESVTEATVSKWLRVPPKIKRGQEGQYWCLFIANATSNTTGTDGTINVSVSRVFNEFPIVD